MNVGQADEKHVVTASRSKLPPQLRDLPKDTDLMVTFATGSVATMACNWVKTTRAAGVTTEVHSVRVRVRVRVEEAGVQLYPTPNPDPTPYTPNPNPHPHP